MKEGYHNEHEPLLVEAEEELPQQDQNKDDDDEEECHPVVVVDGTRRTTSRNDSSGTSTTQRRIVRGTSSTADDDDPSRTTTQQERTSTSANPNNNNNFWCADQRKRLVKQSMTWMNAVARLILWCSFCAMASSIVWYSYELKNQNTEQHLIAWFSAGAFVILGFPVAIYGIFMHLTHYSQPHIQCYIVRILWMVPIYSIESWLCLRFQKSAIYIETLRDCYEAYVLYSFLQFLIAVLGGETELILLLKEKSPTRGVHLSGMKCFIKPWIMGQPTLAANGEVRWTSPFLTKCKFGVLQYVLLKYFCALITVILEFHHLYKEGDFSPKSGYLYICIVINASQCWALYCLAFFYYATSNELAPIRPIGKFLSVKCLVFFTWWQSLGISILSYMGMIPRYQSQSSDLDYTEEEVAKIIQAYLICVEMFGSAIMHYFVFPHTEFSDSRSLSSRQTRPSPLTQRYHRLGRHRKTRHDNSYIHTTATPASKGDQTTLWPTEEPSSEEDGVELIAAIENPNSPAESQNIHLPPAAIARKVPEEDDNADRHDAAEREDIHRIRANSGTTPGFFQALFDSSVPRDVIEDSRGIVKGNYIVEKKTLLHHATASDEYALFVPGTKGFVPKKAAVHNRSSSPTEERTPQVVTKRNRQRPPHEHHHPPQRWEGLNDSADAVFIPRAKQDQPQRQYRS